MRLDPHYKSPSAVKTRFCIIHFVALLVVGTVVCVLPTRVHAQAGSLDTTFNVTLDAFAEDGVIPCEGGVVAFTDDSVLITGGFTLVNETSGHDGIALVYKDGSLDKNFVANAGANSIIDTPVLEPNGNIIAVGTISTLDGSSCPNIGLLDPVGKLLSFKASADNSVSTAAIQSDGHIFAAGSFTQFDGEKLSLVARLRSGPELYPGRCEH